jgi:DNA-directed RNA polymerase specialized sigma subunit
MDYETKDYAEHLLGRLDSEDAEVMKMRYWHDMTLAEIGKEFGVGGSTIGLKILRILKKCRGFIYREVDKPNRAITESEKTTALWEQKLMKISMARGWLEYSL